MIASCPATVVSVVYVGGAEKWSEKFFFCLLFFKKTFQVPQHHKGTFTLVIAL